MAQQVDKLDSPIDVMYLIHRALSAEAARVQRIIEELDVGDSLQPFRAAFNTWATCLMYHADVEDEYMTGPMADLQPARVNEAEHAELAKLLDDLGAHTDKADLTGLGPRLKAAVIALHDQQHVELMERLEEVLAVLDGEIGKTRVIARTRRHLYGKVVAVRICQDDHLESEEAFVLPEVRERMSEATQLDLTRRLLIDEEAEDPNWILDLVARESTPGEQRLLKGLQARFRPLGATAD